MVGVLITLPSRPWRSILTISPWCQSWQRLKIILAKLSKEEQFMSEFILAKSGRGQKDVFVLVIFNTQKLLSRQIIKLGRKFRFIFIYIHKSPIVILYWCSTASESSDSLFISRCTFVNTSLRMFFTLCLPADSLNYPFHIWS